MDLKRNGYLSGRPEELWKELIARHAPGKSFVDVGWMNTMVFLPGLGTEERAALTFQTKRGGSKIGLDSTIESNLGYAPWYWLPTPRAIRSMVEAAGFDVKEVYKRRRVTTVVASKVREPILPPL